MLFHCRSFFILLFYGSFAHSAVWSIKKRWSITIVKQFFIKLSFTALTNVYRTQAIRKHWTSVYSFPLRVHLTVSPHPVSDLRWKCWNEFVSEQNWRNVFFFCWRKGIIITTVWKANNWLSNFMSVMQYQKRAPFEQNGVRKCEAKKKKSKRIKMQKNFIYEKACSRNMFF